MGIFKRRAPNEGAVHVPADIDEARALRAEASEENRKTLLRGFDISQLTAELSARRMLNGFGDDIQITFTRRAS